MAVARFFAGPWGRAVRVLAGLVVGGLGLLTGSVWADVVGLFLVAVGAGNVCVLAPLFGGPLNGRRVRS